MHHKLSLIRLIGLICLISPPFSPFSPFATAASFPAPASLSVAVNTNGVVTAPANFWLANSNALNTVVTGLADYARLSGTNTWTGTNDFAWIVVPDAWWLANSNALNAAVTDTGAGDALLDENNSFTGTNTFAWIVVPDAWWLANSNALNAAIGDLTYAELLADDNDWTGTQRFSEPLTLTLTNSLAWENEGQTDTPTKLHLVSGNLWVHLNDRNRYAFTDGALALDNTNALGWWNSGNTAVQAQITSPSAGIVALGGTGGTYALRLPASGIPSAPPAGQGYLYYRTTDGRLYWRNPTTTYDLTAGLFLGDKGDISVTEGGWILNSNPITATNDHFTIRVADTNNWFGVKLGSTSHANALQVTLNATGNTSLRLAGRGRIKGDDLTDQSTILASSAGLTITPDQGDINLAADVNIPTQTLTIGTNAASAVNPTLLIAPSKTGTASANWRSYADNTRISYSSGSGYAMSSFDAYPTFSGSLNYDHYTAFQARPEMSGTGYLTNLYGFWAKPIISGGAIVPAAYGAYLSQPTVTGGTVVTNRVLYLGAANVGTADNWSLYSAGPVYAASMSIAGVNPLTAFQATNSTLSLLSTNTITGTGTIALSSQIPSTTGLLNEAAASALYQKTNFALTALVANPSMYQASNATLTLLHNRELYGDGDILMSGALSTWPSFADLASYATTESVESVANSLSTLDAEVIKSGTTNLLPVGLSDLNITGPVGYERTVLTGLTPQLNWESHVVVWYYPTDNFTPSQTGTKKPSQKLIFNVVNTNAVNLESTFDGLLWDWQNQIGTIPANSWVSITAEYDPDTDKVYADASAKAVTLTVSHGGTGRTEHPTDHVLLGAGAFPTKAAAIGTGLATSGTGQAMTLSLTNSVPTPSLITHTTVLAGTSVWTNTLSAVTTNTSTALSADLMFSGTTNTVYIRDATGHIRYGPSITTSTNQTFSGNGDGLWARWTTNASFYPVLQVGGIGGQSGLLQLANLTQWSIPLTAATAPEADPWTGHIFTESFEGTGYENTPDILSSGFNADYETVSFHGDQSAYITNQTTARTMAWYLAEGHDRLSGQVSFYVSAHPSATGTHLVQLRDSNTGSGTFRAGVSLRTDGTIRVYNLAGQADNSVAGVPTGSWVTVYWEWVKGTGSNETFKAGWSTDGNKTSTANNIAEFDNGGGQTQIKQYGVIQAANSGNAIAFDAIVIHPTLTWDDLPNGLPDDM